MKTLKQQLSLKGSLEEISSTEFRKNPGLVFESVILGKTFIIKRKNHPIAVISSLPGETLSMIVGPSGKISYGLENRG